MESVTLKDQQGEGGEGVLKFASTVWPHWARKMLVIYRAARNLCEVRSRRPVQIKLNSQTLTEVWNET
jgi:hypothetical protein